MSGISLQFGPEWMRSKQASTPSSIIRPSPNSITRPSPHSMSSPVAAQMPTSSLYSSFVANNTLEQDKDSSSNPFKYSKEEMLQVWMEGGGRGALGVEIELWDGVVKELGGDPVGMRELSEVEKKLFASSLNSEVRRRQSHDILPNSLERPKLNLSSSNTQTSFGQPRLSPLLARRKKDESADSTVSALRRLSLSGPLSPATGPMSPSGGLPSPRIKLGPNSPAYDSIIGDGNWRKKDERRADTLGEPPASIDHNSLAENGMQAGSFNTHHIISATAFRDNTGDVGAVSEALTQVQAALDNEPPLESVLDNRPKLDDYRSLVAKNKDGFSITRPPGFDPDPANITWMYRDPKGNVQGPFSANLMQKWYDEGYFAPDLLVKRSHLDNEWIMVGELAMHARNGKLFLQLYPEYSLPGSFSQSNLLHSPQLFDRFRHSPAPLEGHVVDYPTQQSIFQQHGAPNYVGVSDSYPSTSSLSVQTPSNTSILGIPPSPELPFKHATSNRLSVLQPIADGSASFGQTTTPRNGVIGYDRLDNPEFSHSTLMNQFQAFPGSQELHSSNGSFELTWNRQNINPRNEVMDNGPVVKVTSKQTLYGLSNIDNPYDFSSSSSALHVPLSNHEKEGPKLLPTGDDLHRSLVLIPDPPIALRQNTDGQSAIMGGLPSTPSNQYRPPNSQLYSSSENLQTDDTTSLLATKEISSTVTTLVENTESTESLRTSGEVPKLTQPLFPLSQQPGISVGGMAKRTECLGQKPVASHAIPEVSRKEQHSESVASASIPLAAPSSARPKPAWKNSMPVADDVKLGLREIQEAEARKFETHKPAESEKEQNIRSNNVFIDDPPISPTTWGLPVSQAGNSRPILRESVQQQQSSPVSTQPAPVWISAGKSGQIKQSMKEIQEEEELKKKILAKEKEAGQNKRAYAESANKANPQVGAGVWTTVGASGRHNVLGPPNITTHPATRQTPIATATTTLQSTVSVKATVNRLPGSTAFKVPSRSTSSSADDTPVPPSPEFIKWLRDSLRGFNPGFNTEEFMTMLLAFPLDFPSSTVEVIQDMVYMNSVTMDGRRFAAEFCSKRRSDAANRPRNVNGKQPSLAEVVKTQPKPVQSELPFKVVKKKGKGNAAR